MLAIERRKKILDCLRRDQRVVVAELSREYDVTEETIRRDLEKLEKEGTVKKIYGGAVLNDNVIVDLPYHIRSRENVAEKNKIAELTGDLINDGDHIMIDASSTAVYLVKSIKMKKNLTIITNSVEILLETANQKDWTVLSTGGILKPGSLSLNGYQAERMLTSFHVDKAILSCKGIDLKGGITSSNEMEAHFKRIMLLNSNQKILIVDSSKFNKISFTQIARLDEIDLIVTDKKPDDEWLEKLTNLNIDVLYEKM